MRAEPLTVATPPRQTASPFSIKVDYVRLIPQQIRRQARTVYASRFYGTAQIAGQQVALHFYDVQRLRKLDRHTGRQYSRLDIFLETHPRQRPVFKRIQSIPVTYETWPFGKAVFAIDCFYLDPSLQKNPIIKLRIERRVVSGGMEGRNLVFAFTNGIKQKPVAQSFYYSYPEGPSTSLQNYFDKADKNGVVTILQRYVGSSGITLKGWKWNGSKFALTSEMEIPNTSPQRYEWNGEEIVPMPRRSVQ